MARRLSTLLAVLALAGCNLGGSPEPEAASTIGTTNTAPAPRLTQPAPSQTQLIVQAIRSCEVKGIFFGHGDRMWVTFRGGELTRMRGLDREQLERAAWNHVSACDMVIGME